MDRYDRLGDEPPRSDIAANDAAHEHLHAHTGERHGPDVPLRRDPAVRDLTLEGRIYGDPRWTRRENRSYRWDGFCNTGMHGAGSPHAKYATTGVVDVLDDPSDAGAARFLGELAAMLRSVIGAQRRALRFCRAAGTRTIRNQRATACIILVNSGLLNITRNREWAGSFRVFSWTIFGSGRESLGELVSPGVLRISLDRFWVLTWVA